MKVQINSKTTQGLDGNIYNVFYSAHYDWDGLEARRKLRLWRYHFKKPVSVTGEIIRTEQLKGNTYVQVLLDGVPKAHGTPYTATPYKSKRTNQYGPHIDPSVWFSMKHEWGPTVWVLAADAEAIA